MQAEQHQGKGLRYLTITPDDYNQDRTYPLVIMLHGFGANMQDLAGLSPAISRTGYVYACPNAPMAFDLGGGHIGYGWMAPRGMATPEQVTQAVELLSGFFEEVFSHFNVGPAQAVLMGFSQGGGMTYRCGLTRTESFAGLAALSSTMPDAEELTPLLPQDRTQPIFIAHGLADAMVPMDRAHAALTFLRGAGYAPEYHEYNIGHEISAEVLNDLVPWVSTVLPPLPVGV